MNRGSADEAVVIVKFGADDFMVTWMRAKHRISNRTLEVKGGTRKWSWTLIKDWRAELSQTGTGDYPRRKQWMNPRCVSEESPLQTRVK
jgi:hypothetical protein